MAKKSRWLKPLRIAIFAGIIIFLLVMFSATENKPPEIGPTGSAHIHADFKVYIDGKEVDFSKEEYSERNPYIHLHLDNPYGKHVLHSEASNATLGMFFRSLGMEMNRNCFSENRWTIRCSIWERKLRMFVNGAENFEFDSYVPKDLDRILVTWGSSEHDIAVQMTTVTDYACQFSRKCPERAEDGERTAPF